MRNISPGSGHANCHNGSLKMHTRSELKCKCCFSISGLILTNVRCRIWWGHLSLSLAVRKLTLRTMWNIELLHGFGLQLMASPSLPPLRFWRRWTETVTVANTSYDTNWNKPLTWCLAAAEGGDGLDRMGGKHSGGLGGGLRLIWWSLADRPMSKHPLLVLAEGEAKTLDNHTLKEPQHSIRSPMFFWTRTCTPKRPHTLMPRPNAIHIGLPNKLFNTDYCGSDTFQWGKVHMLLPWKPNCQDSAMEENIWLSGREKKQHVLVMHSAFNLKTVLHIDLREMPQKQSQSCNELH